MKQKNYKYLLYFISATIAIIVTIQVYWNSQNYAINKKRFHNEVQISLDNSVETYYADLAKTDFFSLIEEKETNTYATISKEMFQFIDKIDLEQLGDEVDNSLNLYHSDTISSFHTKVDSFNEPFDTNGKLEGITIVQGKAAFDSIESFSGLVNKLTVSITRDSIDFAKLDTILKNELSRKKININFGLTHFKNDTVFENFEEFKIKGEALNTFSKSTYLPIGQKIQLQYGNPTFSILKRSLTSILLSLILSACTIACLFYLLHIINKQKELAEIKNDLISNITHEFKTPIATAFTAIEGIKSFNKANDSKKTQTYLELSNQQLNKLNHMVEKLLETATLDSDKLLLKKEEVDLAFLLQKIVDNHLLTTDKTIKFKANIASISTEVDVFHFENAIGNLVDNAIKYGGDTIEMNLNSVLSNTEITVADNGGGIDKNQRDKIFDKFYRVPTGNRHDVKGFGIGLFYTKKIIEKHEGSIELIPNNSETIFKITL